ANRGEI
ncbi:unnamed protein product, partial [Parascedosporium putredinis]